MKIEINITKTNMVIILSAIFFVGGMIFAFAYNSSGTGGKPAVMGHSVDEINWAQPIKTLLNIGSTDGYNWDIGVNNNTYGNSLVFHSQNQSNYSKSVYFTASGDICSNGLGGACLSQTGPPILCTFNGELLVSKDLGCLYVKCDGTKVNGIRFTPPC